MNDENILTDLGAYCTDRQAHFALIHQANHDQINHEYLVYLQNKTNQTSHHSQDTTCCIFLEQD